ncbi:hypothetical protein ACS0TY_030164 [Phlomoides rotata]
MRWIGPKLELDNNTKPRRELDHRLKDLQTTVGPIDDNVLNQQHSHRSRLISITMEHSDTLLQLMQVSQNVFWTTRANPEEDEFVLQPCFLDTLQLMGFYDLARCVYIKLDRHLITSLVERWHPETHTFHFPVGEVTVILHNVAIIWRLPIEGEPVVCREPNCTKEDWHQYCNSG